MWQQHETSGRIFLGSWSTPPPPVSPSLCSASLSSTGASRHIQQRGGGGGGGEQSELFSSAAGSALLAAGFALGLSGTFRLCLGPGRLGDGAQTSGPSQQLQQPRAWIQIHIISPAENNSNRFFLRVFEVEHHGLFACTNTIV